jgi:predicted dithiol-disulfide oxidoreductase (DUF899 family)
MTLELSWYFSRAAPWAEIDHPQQGNAKGDLAMKTYAQSTKAHRIVSKDEWLQARIELLAREKDLTHKRDEISRQRRELPWVKVEKEYTFDAPQGNVKLAELFDGRSQLVVYHFMFGPAWQEGCPSCSFLMDHVDGTIVHLNARDVTMVMVSRAPLAKIEGFKKRMGWRFKWVSSYGSDFNSDFRVAFTKEELANGSKTYNFGSIPPYGEETHGLSVFYKKADGEVFHTYSTYARGCEPLVGTYSILDLVPKGRNEDALSFSMAWVRHHDRYEPHSMIADSCCQATETHT